MRKFLLALIAFLVAVIAYASPGSPYLSYGWRPSGGTHAAPTVVNSFGGTAYPGATVTLSGISAGDVLLIIAVSRGAASGTTVSCSAGITCTALTTQTVDTSDNGALWAAYKVAAGGETSVTVSDTPGGFGWMVIVYQLRGVDNVTPTDFTVNTVAYAAGTSRTSGSVTPGHNNALIFAISAVDNTNNTCTTAASTSTATGTTNAWTTAFFAQTDTTRCANAGVGYATQTTAGAITVTGSQTNAGTSPLAAIWTIGFKSSTP